MRIYAIILMIISGTMIFWAMIGYPFSIKILSKIYRNKINLKQKDYTPNVTILIAAHNEEKVIKDKLINLLELDYPINKLSILVSSDFSTDHTNEIVEEFIKNNNQIDIKLYKVKKRLGKTNAQNEAYSLITSEFIVMTDANTMLEKNSIRELMSSFYDDSVAYVCGNLIYINGNDSITACSENTYWEKELYIRDIESRIHSITAGNGALYACRKKDYIFCNPMESHDTYFPLYFTKNGKRAINNKNAIAYEKAGESDNDEFKRKVRSNRLILNVFKNSFMFINIFKYKWFSYFYFGHRTCRYLLFLNHLIFFITSFILSNNRLVLGLLILQIAFISIGILVKENNNNTLLRMIYYYQLTLLAQCVAIINTFLKKNKCIWEKAESTR